MILKIARYTGNREWWIIDGIKRISYGYEVYKQNQVRGLPDLLLEDHWENQINCESGMERSVISGTYLRENGEEVTFEFDTIAYLLNDQGTTIEKLVANYGGEPEGHST